MNLLTATKDLSLKARLSLVALIALLLGVVPSSILLLGYSAELRSVALEQRGLPINKAWQGALNALQQHRNLAAESLSTKPESKTGLAAVQQATRTALNAVTASLDGSLEGDDTRRHIAAVAQVSSQFDALSTELDAGKLDVSRLLARQQALANLAFRAIADFNGAAGLLLDPDPAAYFSIIAGLQAAPQVEDALSELGAMARAAAVDDIGSVASALTRYREYAGQMLQQMEAAEGVGGPMQKELAPMVTKAREQRQLVDATMQAAALDVNYPLEQLAASFSAAAALQATVSARVLETLTAQLDQRNSDATLKRNLLLVLIPLLLAVLSLAMLRAIRQLLGPVALMVEVTERIAAGDLSQAVPTGRRDELGRVLLGLQHMQDRLRQLVEQIHAGAGNIRVAAQEIADGNQDLASRTETAAAHLQRTSSNVDLLDQVVQQSTLAAAEATALAHTASGVASQGGVVVKQVVDTMDSIHEASRRIADITGLIDGIAFQTNILALNAAVEAARAGEQGRGFAVVAAEVRSLAGRSADAAKEIKGLIQRSVERVESGTVLASRAGEAMQQIVAQVEQVSTVILAMDKQARTQAGQTTELSRSVREIDAMTQQNAALVEQSAASAESLRGQAEAMDTAVQAFRL